MSHDLYLFPSTPKTTADFQKLTASFPMKVDGNEAFYEHPSTGCHFMLRWSPGDLAGERKAHLHADVNYVRPSTFGLEAASVIADIVSDWQCSVEDPQINGHGTSTVFSQEAYLSGWNSGNEMGYRVLVDRKVDLVENGMASAPSASIHKVWEWNDRVHSKRIRLDGEKKDFFVPTVYWLANPQGAAAEKVSSSWIKRVLNRSQSSPATQQTSGPHRIMIWGDNTPSLLPAPITHAIVMGPMFDAALGAEKVMRLVSRAGLEALASYRKDALWPTEPAWACGVIGSGGPLPRDLATLAQAGMIVTPGKIPILQAAKVLDAELFDAISSE
jgi:hypothetical protein